MPKVQAPKQRHVPMRTCIATGKKLPKSEMVRLVRLENSDSEAPEVKVDPKGKERGRGASIEMDISSFDLAVKKGAIERALKLDKKLTAAQVADLREQFAKAIDEKSFRKGNRKVVIKISKDELESKLAE